MGELQERGADVRRLHEALDTALEGDGALVVLEGPAGIGKTRLLRELRSAARERRVRVLSARGADHEQDFAFGVARQLLEREVIGRSGDQELLRGAAALATVPLGLEVTGAPTLDAPDPAFAALHGLYWLVSNLAAEGPLVLEFDDAHWADEPSLRFLAYLARRLDGLPVLVAVACRPDREEVLALAAEPGAVLIRPGVLSPDAVAALAADVFDTEPERPFTDACHAATGGVPFFVTELLRALADDGTRPVAAEREGVLRIGAPAVTRSVVMRLGALPESAARLVGPIAVLGTEATVGRAAELAGLDEVEAAAAVDALAKAHLLGADGPLNFAHPIIAATVEGELLPGERARLHAAAARLLQAAGADAGRIAQLLLATDPTGEAWVVWVLRQAAREAIASGAPQIAARLLARALREPLDGDRGAVLAELGEAQLRAGDAAAVEQLRAALETPAGGGAEAREGGADARGSGGAAAGGAAVARTRLLGRALAAAGRPAEAVDTLGALADALRDDDPESARILDGDLVAVALLEHDLAPRAAARLERHRDAAGATPGERLVLVGLAQRAWVSGRSCADTAALARRALADGALLADESADSVALNQAMFALVVADHTDEVEPHLAAAREEARSRGSWYGYAAASSIAAVARFREGRVADTETEARAALEGGEHALISPIARAFLALALCERGDTDGAEAALDHYPADLPASMPSIHLIIARARTALQRGDWAAAQTLALDAGRREARFGIENPALGWRLLLAAADARAGNLVRAGELVAEQATMAGVWGAPSPIGAVQAATALFTPDPPAALRAALETLRAGSDRLAEARTLVDLGAALRRANERVAAREPLTEALTLAQRLGSHQVAERAHKELRVAGAKPRRLQFSGVDSLTAAERRVAELAAQGRSNREIAQSLFVTAKTVENHLGRAYRKLGVASREALGDALE